MTEVIDHHNYKVLVTGHKYLLFLAVGHWRIKIEQMNKLPSEPIKSISFRFLNILDGQRVVKTSVICILCKQEQESLVLILHCQTHCTTNIEWAKSPPAEVSPFKGLNHP